MNDLLIAGGTIVNEGQSSERDVLVRQGRIERIDPAITPPIFSLQGNRRIWKVGLARLDRRSGTFPGTRTDSQGMYSDGIPGRSGRWSNDFF